MRNSRGLNIAAGLTTVGAWVALFFFTWELPPRVASGPHEAVGWMLAQEALRLRTEGGPIIVIARDTTEFKQPAMDVQLRSLTRAIRQGQTTIAAFKAIEVDPLRVVEVPAGDFMELIRKVPAGSVIVSSMGPPLLTGQQRLQLGPIRPKIVAFCPGNLPDRVDLREVFAQGLLEVAIVSRRNPPRSHPGNLRACYDQFFQTITASNVDRFYAAAGEER